MGHPWLIDFSEEVKPLLCLCQAYVNSTSDSADPWSQILKYWQTTRTGRLEGKREKKRLRGVVCVCVARGIATTTYGHQDFSELEPDSWSTVTLLMVRLACVFISGDNRYEQQQIANKYDDKLYCIRTWILMYSVWMPEKWLCKQRERISKCINLLIPHLKQIYVWESATSNPLKC